MLNFSNKPSIVIFGSASVIKCLSDVLYPNQDSTLYLFGDKYINNRIDIKTNIKYINSIYIYKLMKSSKLGSSMNGAIIAALLFFSVITFTDISRPLISNINRQFDTDIPNLRPLERFNIRPTKPRPRPTKPPKPRPIKTKTSSIGNLGNVTLNETPVLNETPDYIPTEIESVVIDDIATNISHITMDSIDVK